MFQKSVVKFDIKEWIKSEAIKLNFATVGFTKPLISENNSNGLIEFLSKNYHGDMGWMEKKSEIRLNPLKLWKKTKSCIVLGDNYAPDHNPLDTLKFLSKGNISVYARGRDYHHIIKGKLKELSSKLISKTNWNVKVFVDTAPIMEKPLAQNSGIGWQGKNTVLISKKYGSWLFLGIILTDGDISYDYPEDNNCGTCDACLKICPTNAFVSPYKLDSRKCISYLTIEYKGHISEEYRKPIGNRVFGCDDCLAICPWNKFATISNEIKFKNKNSFSFTNIENLLKLTEDSFRKTFSKTPVKRSGYISFIRNVLIASGNSKNKKLIKVILPYLKHKNPILRAMAVWSIGQHLDKKNILKHYKNCIDEEDKDVKKEWDRVMKF